MLVIGDLAELWGMWDPSCAVQVVKHDYKPRNKRKYIGTTLEADNECYERKNWSSLILWSCSYAAHRTLTPQHINETEGPKLHRFGWLPDDRIGELPKEWNVLIDEDNQSKDAKLAHFTNGLPGFLHYGNAPHSDKWKQSWHAMNIGMQHKVTIGTDGR